MMFEFKKIQLPAGAATPSFPSSAFIRVAIWLVMAVGPITFAQARQIVEIHLHAPTVFCFENTIHIKDIAEIKNGTLQLREKLGNLDLDEFTAKGTPVEISGRLIHYRILVAGFDESKFKVTGNRITVALFSRPIDATLWVQQALTEQLSSQFQLSPSSLEVTVNRQLDTTIEQAGLDPATLSVIPQFSTELPVGNKNIEVILSDSSGKSLKTNLSVKIAVYRDLIMAKQNISRGDVLSADKIERVRRPVDSQQVRFASYDQAIGKQAQSDIQQFSLVKAQFIRTVNNESQYLVKRNSRLNIEIKRGALSVTLKDARADQNGKIGDYIFFTNPKSNKKVRARIVNASTAVIE